MKKLIYLIVAIFTMASCERDGEQIKIPDGNDGKGAVIFTLETTQTTKPVDNIHIYGFNHLGELTDSKYYPSPEAIALDMTIGIGVYTFVAVVNVGESFTHPSQSTTSNLSLVNFMTWLKANESSYPNLLSGTVQVDVKVGEISRAIINLIDGVESNTLRLILTLPTIPLPDFKTKSNIKRTDDYTLRAIAEVYKKGTDALVLRHSTILANNSIDLHIIKGDYDILIWTDYTLTDMADHHYTTENLKRIRISEAKEYTANTNSRDANALSFEATVGSDGITEKAITLDRPLAQYKIVATDVEEYKAINGTTALDGLKITIAYQDNLPCAFDVSDNIPIDAKAGVSYTTPNLIDLTATTATIGSDYLFINGAESTISVTITITNNKGEKVATIPDVAIKHRRNHLTTVSGKFLTAGVTTGGISIDTDWDEEENNHDFE